MRRHGAFFEFETENWSEKQIDQEDLKESNWQRINPKEKATEYDEPYKQYLREYYSIKDDP